MIIIRSTAEPFKYHEKSSGSRMTNPDILAYIKSLVIPPKYTQVKIYVSRAGGKISQPAKLTYTGIDEAGRTQYGYSEKWKKAAKKKKFKDLIEFGRTLPKIRKHINKVLSANNHPINLDFCVSLIIKIVGHCHFRVGSIKYKDVYRSYGVSTIEVRHIDVNTERAIIKFVGKKGVKNKCIIKDKSMIHNINRLISDKDRKDPVFSYVFEDCVTPVKATDINVWLSWFSPNITSKMFRTYATNTMLIEILLSRNIPSTLSKRKKMLNEALDKVSALVHNTRAVCKKEYAHPELIRMFLEHPRKFKSTFDCGDSPEVAFLTYLKR